MFRLMPRQVKLFERFEQLAQAAHEAAIELTRLLDDFQHPQAHLERIASLERKGDEINHQATEMLQKGFTAPVGQSEVVDLLGELDDILDGTDAAAQRLLLYRAQAIRPEAHALGKLLERCAAEVVKTVSALRTAKDASGVLTHVVEVNRLENEGDEVTRRAIGALFEHEKDAVEIIKWKEIFEILEEAIDSCEKVANAVERMVLRQA